MSRGQPLDFLKLIDIMSKLNQNEIIINNYLSWEIFQCFHNHVCTNLSLNLPNTKVIKSSIVSLNPLQILAINTLAYKSFLTLLCVTSGDLNNSFS